MSAGPPPSLKLGLAGFLAYVVTIVVVNLITGSDYEEIGRSADEAIRGLLIPITAGSLVIGWLAWRWGWWGAAMRERVTVPRWTLVVPALVGLAVIGGLISADYDRPGDLIAIIVVGTLIVGFGEEMTTRGVLLVGARAELREVGVWFLTSLLFGLMHGLNLVFGQNLGDTLVQIVFAFFFGSVMYVARRATGLLVVTMLLHGFWDMATFLNTPVEDTADRVASGGSLQGVVAEIAAIVAIVALVKLFDRKGRERGLADSPASA